MEGMIYRFLTVRSPLQAVEKTKTYNEEHKVLERTKQATKDAYQRAKAFDEKHNVGKKLASAAAFISKQLKDEKKNDNGDSTDKEKNNASNASTTKPKWRRRYTSQHWHMSKLKRSIQSTSFPWNTRKRREGHIYRDCHLQGILSLSFKSAKELRRSQYFYGTTVLPSKPVAY